MSLIIEGMNMPKDYKSRSATLDRQTDDGILRLFVNDFDSEARKYSCRVYPIVEVPTPHGRLIDADLLLAIMRKRLYGNLEFDYIIGLVERQRTIIEAEESNSET